MLRAMRENSGSWIIKIILGLIVIAFVGIGVGSYGSRNRGTVATIGDTTVSIQEYQDSYNLILNQLRGQFGDYLNEDTLKMFNVKQQALDRIIENHLISLQAENLDIIVSDEEMQNELAAVDAFKRNGRFDLDQYKRVLAYQQTNPEIFEAQIRQDLKNQKVRQLVVSAIAVSDPEAEAWYINKNSKVSVDYLGFDPGEMTDVSPSDEEITAYYEKNKAQYQSEPKRVARYVRYSPEDYREGLVVDKEKVERYYAENKSEFEEPEKAEARHILIKLSSDADDAAVEEARKKAAAICERAKSGEDFAELAKKESQGPSASSGGYLGTFGRGAMVKPFEEAVFSMNTGDISEPVRTQFGWHVIKVEKKFDAGLTSLEEAYPSIEKKLKDTEIETRAYELAGKAFDLVIDGDDLEQVAVLTGTTVQTTPEFTETGAGLQMSSAGQFAAQAFKMSLNTISDIKKIGDDYFLIKIVTAIDPEIQPLDTVKYKVTRDLTGKMQEEKATALATAVLEEAGNGKRLADIANEKNLELKTTEPFLKKGVVPEIGSSLEFLEAAFNLTEPGQVHDTLIKTDKGVFVIALNERILPDKTETAGELTATKREILSAKQNQVYTAWLEELKQRSDIQINPDFFD